MMNVCKLVLAIALLSGGILRASAATSEYTEFDFDFDCVFYETHEQGASAYCKGYKGYPLHFAEGDLRQMARFGHIAKTEGQWESFGQFNYMNFKIEWRLHDGVPFATIVRWFIENSTDGGEPKKADRGQVLVISKVASHASAISCVVGYVDARANKNANTIAREVADTFASDFKCGKDEPEWHKVRGKYSGDNVNYFE